MLDKIRGFIEGTLLNGVGTVSPDQSLFESGALDSLKLLKLISYLEKEFGISFTAKEMRVENFGTIPRLVDLVQRKIAERD